MPGKFEKLRRASTCHSKKTQQLTLAIKHLDRTLARKFILKGKTKTTDVTAAEYERFFKSAVESRDTSLVRKLLETGPKLDGTVGAQLLWEVIHDADTRIAEMLVRAGTDVNQSFAETSISLLHVLAVSRRKHELALLMMEHGANARAKDAHGCTVCEVAINLALARELLNRGAAIDSVLLLYAIRGSTPLESMLLIVNGEHIERATERSKLVADTFQTLCRFGNDDKVTLDMMKALLDLEIPPVSVILIAVKCERICMVKLLLERTDIVDGVKMRFLREAAGLPRSTMARLLVEWGADIEYQDPDAKHPNRGKRPLHAACLRESYENIRLLLHLGADINAADYYKITPFLLLILQHHHSLLSSEPFNEICRLATKHYALLASKDVAVGHMDLASMESYPTLQLFYDECMGELQEMKTVEITVGLTFYSIFTMSIQELSLLMRRQMFVDAYNGNSNSFPVYCNDLSMRVREAERRKILFMLKEDAIYESLRGILPDIPMEKIVRYVYLGDVETLQGKLIMLDS